VKILARVPIIAAGFLLACASTALAIPVTVYDTLHGGSGDVDNVLYQSNDQGTTVNATINSNPGFAAVFTSTTEIKESGGQSSLKAADGTSYTDLCFSLTAGSTFTKLQINPDAIANGTITFQVTYLLPAGVFNSVDFTLNMNGQNFFTIEAGDGALLTEVCWTSTVGISDANQYRVGGLARATTTNVPDGGSTVALLGFGLTGLGFISRRLRK